MNEAALLAACDAAPGDPAPRLVLADWLEEAGTPGRAVVARLLRQSAKALQEGTPAAQGALTRLKNRIAKARPATVAWFEWWFEPTVSEIVKLHSALDRRALARFVVRCARETPARTGGAVADVLDNKGRATLAALERFAGGHDLTDSDWKATESFLPPAVRTLWRTYVSHAVCVGLGNVAEALDYDALALADRAVPAAIARRGAVTAASRCAGAFADGWEQQGPARELHRRLLHECVPCPFDPEGDR